MSWDAAVQIFSLALGSSFGIILYTIALHSSPTVVRIVDKEAFIFPLALDGGNFSINDRAGEDKFLDNLYHSNDTAVHKDDDQIARYLYKRIRIFCIVRMDTFDENAFKFSRYLLEKRCNKLLYFSKAANASQNIIGVNISKIGNVVSAVANEAFRYTAKHHLLDADWFILLDLDSYVIMENLRYFLSSVFPGDLLYFGATSIDLYGKPHLCSDIVLSRNALESLAIALESYSVERASDPDTCILTEHRVGMNALACFRRLGFKAVDTTDSLGRTRMHCFYPLIEVNKAYPTWFLKHNQDHRANATGVSDYAISFGTSSLWKQRGLEYVVYHLSPYGISFGNEDLNALQLAHE